MRHFILRSVGALAALAIMTAFSSPSTAEVLRRVKRIDGTSPLGKRIDGMPLVQDAGMSHYYFNRGAAKLTVWKVKGHNAKGSVVKAHQRWSSSKAAQVPVQAHSRMGTLRKESIRASVTVGVDVGTSRYVFEPPLAKDPVRRQLPTVNGLRVKIPRSLLGQPSVLAGLLKDKAR